ncbi:A disintegrin and metalloproteinase with thrombospondin motifs 20-like protein [Lates japonicus]|uniref:A disintegrin and metalloproteinase with thrombospondin motifs 20-like protein n=1 Tax=Lates japonicus TaxID=270547 RepID=A0AAD3R7X6_LATJO|nr:A disintegrin and metalloproteinase with thrombospondin motifs 20-like protein [Lates japonicus]
MQFAIWLVGLMCHLSALVRDTLQYRLHPKQESFIKQLSSYEIITPLRVNDFGESFPHTLHYRRRRRSLNDDLSGLRVHYRIDAFGDRFHLNMTADSGFIAPSYTVTHLGAEQSNDTDSYFHNPSDMRHCFFRGHVNAKSEYPAVFSLCTGLIGTFTTQHGEYFLEPLINAAGEEYDEEQNKPHLVYRHDKKRNISNAENNREPCAASEDSKGPVSFESRENMGEELDSLRATIDDQHIYENNSTAMNPRSPRRRKRFLSYPRYVELMVTADAKMVRHHGRNLEHYILTIMFNMPHDDNPKCREAGIKHQYHVMAPTLNYDTNPWTWSKCSRKYITEFLDTGYGECLLDEPVGRTYELPTLLPGQIYNANRQCELMFGPGSQICPYMKQCKRLWCTSAEGDHKGCRTQHMPLADGTDCGHGMWSGRNRAQAEASQRSHKRPHISDSEEEEAEEERREEESEEEVQGGTRMWWAGV